MRPNPRIAKIARIALGLAAAFVLTLPAASRAQSTDASCPMHEAHTAGPATPPQAEGHVHSEHAMSPYAGQEGF